MLILVFSGQLLEGFERDLVIANLAHLFKKSPAAIKTAFFVNQPCVVKRVENTAMAEKWRLAFAKAGAVLEVTLEPEQEQEQEPVSKFAPDTVSTVSASAPVHSNNGVSEPLNTRLATNEKAVADESINKASKQSLKASKSRYAKRFWLVGLLGGLMLLVIAALWVTRPFWYSLEFDQTQQAVLAALASEDLYALGHIDLARIQALESFKSEHFSGDESEFSNLPGLGNDFWSSLEQANIQVREQVTQAWAAGYYSASTTINNTTNTTTNDTAKSITKTSESAQVLFVITGKFNPAQMTAWVKQRYLVVEETTAGLLITPLDKHTCQKKAPQLITITPTQILVGTPARVASFQARLQAGNAAAIDLTHWHTISAPQLASLAVFVPKDLAQAVGGLPGMLLREVSTAATPATGFFLGLDTVKFPPGLELGLVVTSDDKEFLSNSYSVINNRVTDMKTEAKVNWPETLALYNRISLTQSKYQLRTALRFDNDLQQEMSQLLASFLSNSFSIADSNSSPEEERLDESPPQFSDVTSTVFTGFKDVQYLDNQFEPQVVSGPFGIGLQHVASTEAGPEIELAVRAFNLPNLGGRRSAVTLIVNDVVDHAGKSLVPIPHCGEDLVRKPSDINSVFSHKTYIDNQEIPYTSLSGDAKVRLPLGTDLNDVAAIHGDIKFVLPKTVERIRLNSPLAGQLLENNGIKIRFFASDESTLQYEYSGQLDALLHIVALNAEGKPLASSSSMRSQAFFGSSQTVSTHYSGKIAGVELIIARQLETITYPFSITSFQPTADASDFPLQPQPQLLTDHQWQVLQQDSAPNVIEFWRPPHSSYDAGPARLVLQDLSFNKHFGMQLNAEVYFHNQHPLVNTLGAVGLTVTELATSNGTVQPASLAAQFPVSYEGGMWWNGEYKANEEKPWLRGSVSLRDESITLSDVVSLQANLSITRAKTMAELELPLNLGQRWTSDIGALTFVRWEQGQLVFSVTDDLSQVIAVQAIAGDNAIVSEPADLQWGLSGREVRVRYRAQPTAIRILYATETEQLNYPVTIRVVPETNTSD